MFFNACQNLKTYDVTVDNNIIQPHSGGALISIRSMGSCCDK